ncbi:E3 ubiquitin-protein ligase TRIP12 [Pelomyxa schiedti]|nr:E3 ubiquitin-protein ligase TRIP12 [Pelomyxa schiedti]
MSGHSVRETLVGAGIDVSALDALNFDMDGTPPTEFLRQLDENKDDVDASLYLSVRQALSVTDLHLKLKDIGLCDAEESVCKALRMCDKPCTLAGLREAPPAIFQDSGCKLGWTLKLQRRAVPISDPGGTPYSKLKDFPPALVNAGFQDLEDLLPFNVERLIQSVKMPKKTAVNVLENVKKELFQAPPPLSVSSNPSPSPSPLPAASAFPCMLEQVSHEPHHLVTMVEGSVHKVQLLGQNVLSLANRILGEACITDGEFIDFDKLDRSKCSITLGFFGDPPTVTQFLMRTGAFSSITKLPVEQPGIHAFITSFAPSSHMQGIGVMILVFIPAAESFSLVQISDPACLLLRFFYTLCDRIFFVLSGRMIEELHQQSPISQESRLIHCVVQENSIQERCEVQKGFTCSLPLPNKTPWMMCKGSHTVGFVSWQEVPSKSELVPVTGNFDLSSFKQQLLALLQGSECNTESLTWEQKFQLLDLCNHSLVREFEGWKKRRLDGIAVQVVLHMRMKLSCDLPKELLQSPMFHSLPKEFSDDLVPTCLDTYDKDLSSLLENNSLGKSESSWMQPGRWLRSMTGSHISSAGTLEATDTLAPNSLQQRIEALVKKIKVDVLSNPSHYYAAWSKEVSSQLDKAIAKELPSTNTKQSRITNLSLDHSGRKVELGVLFEQEEAAHLEITVIEMGAERTAESCRESFAEPRRFSSRLATVLSGFLLPSNNIMLVGTERSKGDPNLAISIRQEGHHDSFFTLKRRASGCIFNFCESTRVFAVAYPPPIASVHALMFTDSYNNYQTLGSFSFDPTFSKLTEVIPLPGGHKVMLLFPTTTKLYDFEHNKICDLKVNGRPLIIDRDCFVTLSQMEVSGSCESARISVRSFTSNSTELHCDTNLLNPQLLGSTILVDFCTAGKLEKHLVQYHASENRISSVVLEAQVKRTDFRMQSSKIVSNQQLSRPILDYLYLMFDKFPITAVCDTNEHCKPCKLMVVVPTLTPEISTLVSKCLAKRQTLLSGLFKVGRERADEFFSNHVTCGIEEGWNESDSDCMEPTGCGRWLKTLISQVPIQIARVDNNCLEIIDNGVVQKPRTIGNKDQNDVADEISFGLLESVFASCTRKPVFVVTSMGKQSTGKSYVLNHLLGVLFDISGGRCTNGCWMSVREKSDRLIVALDFEGLCSLERSMEEDLLLSVLNAAVSNLTLFRTALNVDRETEQMFQKFQRGIGLVHGDEKLFRGFFALMARDVEERDISSLGAEFESKFRELISQNQGNNFLTCMFSGQFEFILCHHFGTPGYNESLERCKTLLQEQRSQFLGAEFVDEMKLLLAKLNLKDWSSLVGQDVKIAIKKLQKGLPSAISYGRTKVTSPVGQLTNFLTREVISCDEVELSGLRIPISHFNLDTTDEQDLLRIRNELKAQFEKYFPKIKQSVQSGRDQFKKFVELVIESRKNHVKLWISSNIKAEWREDQNVIAFQTEVARAMQQLDALALCTNTCDNCGLLCLLLRQHSGEHDCCGSHHCEDHCVNCNQLGKKTQCFYTSAHSGAHDCRQGHTCNKTCQLLDRDGCNKFCSLPLNHDGGCKCSARSHTCGDPCSAIGPGGQPCARRCKLSCDSHKQHDCGMNKCLHACFFSQNCRNTCASHHFHGNEDSTANTHLCANAHRCPEICNQDGCCEVKYIRRPVTFRVSVKEPNIEYDTITVPEQRKLPCCAMIPEGKLTHGDSHRHSEHSTHHFCLEVCPACGYNCQLKFGHKGQHDTGRHGKMIHAHFVSTENDIELHGQVYRAGEVGWAKMCDSFCVEGGRGHIHVLPCKSKTTCSRGEEGLRHAVVQYNPDPDSPKDELTHEKYWNFINFVDPCAPEQIPSFKQCPHACCNSHRDRVMCLLPLWHPPCPLNKGRKTTFLEQVGYASEDGHLFSHLHGTPQDLHVVFCLDRSSSMKSALYSWGTGYSNAWEALVISVKTYIQRRDNPNDLYSFVFFSGGVDHVIPPCTREEALEFESKVSGPFGSSTAFSPALLKCQEVLRSTNWDEFSAQLIVVSDGGDKTGKKELCAIFKEFQGKVPIYCISIGAWGAEEKMMELAGNVGQHRHTEIPQLAETLKMIASVPPQNVSLMPNIMEAPTSPDNQEPNRLALAPPSHSRLTLTEAICRSPTQTTTTTTTTTSMAQQP